MLTSEVSEARWWRGLKAIRRLMSGSSGRLDSGSALSTWEAENIAGYARLAEFLVRERAELFSAIEVAEQDEPGLLWGSQVDGELHQLAGALHYAFERLMQLAQELERMRAERADRQPRQLGG